MSAPSKKDRDMASSQKNQMPSTSTHSDNQSRADPSAPAMVQPGATVPPKKSATDNQPDCPPGLKHLATIDKLLVQHVEPFEVFTDWESENHYKIKNIEGQQVYFAGERSNACCRNCLGSSRSFEMRVVDNSQREVIRMNRPMRNCLQAIEVFSPPGRLVGTVQQRVHVRPKFDVKDAAGDTVIKIKGPFWTGGDGVKFKVLSADGVAVGVIAERWRGLASESMDASCIGVAFPVDLDVRMKAVMLGACFLIDAMYFEDKKTIEQISNLIINN